MANEIQAAYSTGATLYALVWDSTSQIWNGSAFAAYSAGSYASYPVTMTEAGASGHYAGTFPAASAGTYSVEVRLRAGGSPAQSDAVVAAGTVNWTGTAVLTPASAAQVATAAQVLAAFQAWAVETGFTFSDAMKALSASLVGNVTGDGTSYKAAANSGTARLTVSADSSGNRTVSYSGA